MNRLPAAHEKPAIPATKAARQSRVAALLEGTRVHSQGELAQLLSHEGVYVTQATPTPAPDTGLVQGMVEESNVKPIVEMTRMMTVAQDFASAQKLLDSESDREKTAIDKLGRVA